VASWQAAQYVCLLLALAHPAAGGLLGLLCALSRAPVLLFLGMLLAAMAGEVIVTKYKKENTGTGLCRQPYLLASVCRSPATPALVESHSRLSYEDWLHYKS